MEDIPPLEDQMTVQSTNTPGDQTASTAVQNTEQPNTETSPSWENLQQRDMEALPQDLREFIQHLREHVESHLTNNSADNSNPPAPQTTENQESTSVLNSEPVSQNDPSPQPNAPEVPQPPSSRPTRAMIRFVIFYENADVPLNSLSENPSDMGETTDTRNQENLNSTQSEPLNGTTEPQGSEENNTNTQQNTQSPNSSSRRQIRHLIFNMLLPLNGSDTDDFHNTLNQLFLAHEVRGPPPVSKRVLERLHQVEVDDAFLEHNGSCTICFEPFEIKSLVTKLPCNHSFHMDCLTPWFKDRNNCPLCRYELPVDDEEYEQQRKKRMAVRNIVKHKVT